MTSAREDAEQGDARVTGLVVVGDPDAGMCVDGVCTVPQSAANQRSDEGTDPARSSLG